MKKFIYIVLAILMIVALFVGCNPPPKPPPVIVPEGVICEGGRYSIYWGGWSMTGCEGDEQVKGTYWKNADGRMFLLGDVVEFDPDGKTLDNIIKVYGKCPTSFVKEIVVK